MPHTLIFLAKDFQAKYHFLVLVKDLALKNISSLTTTECHISLLERMKSTALQYVQNNPNLPSSTFIYGFHAIPSMNLLHLHCISGDFISDCMKKKQHWNSFTTPFLIPIDEILASLRSNQRIIIDPIYYNSLMNLPLKCNRCASVFSSFSQLKRHLYEYLSTASIEKIQ